ncbi:hypothetical protein [Aliiroseovarius sp. YM-037]|uniref:T4 family baseplate hub assembly chaperone n=1 Tax=Aliiroseovarius sp. YM-037 TaxID=3341728 RepID=UPI003A803A8D
MSRPEASATRGQAITLSLAPIDGERVTATVQPLTGADELRLAERRTGGATSPVELETLILDTEAVTLSVAGHADDLLIGDRNRIILAVLCTSYGAPREFLLRCPDCGETQELPFDPLTVLGARPTGPAGEVFAVAAEGHDMTMRLPIGADLVAIRGAEDGGKALLARCAPSVPATEAGLAAVEAEIAARDGCAEIVFSSTCIECGADVGGLLDPLMLLLGEMDRLGGVLAEIDCIARAYHWSEAELLALPAYRRRLYLRAIEDAAQDAERRRAS